MNIKNPIIILILFFFALCSSSTLEDSFDDALGQKEGIVIKTLKLIGWTVIVIGWLGHFIDKYLYGYRRDHIEEQIIHLERNIEEIKTYDNVHKRDSLVTALTTIFKNEKRKHIVLMKVMDDDSQFRKETVIKYKLKNHYNEERHKYVEFYEDKKIIFNVWDVLEQFKDDLSDKKKEINNIDEYEQEALKLFGLIVSKDRLMCKNSYLKKDIFNYFDKYYNKAVNFIKR